MLLDNGKLRRYMHIQVIKNSLQEALHVLLSENVASMCAPSHLMPTKHHTNKNVLICNKYYFYIYFLTTTNHNT